MVHPQRWQDQWDPLVLPDPPERRGPPDLSDLPGPPEPKDLPGLSDRRDLLAPPGRLEPLEPRGLPEPTQLLLDLMVLPVLPALKGQQDLRDRLALLALTRLQDLILMTSAKDQAISTTPLPGPQRPHPFRTWLQARTCSVLRTVALSLLLTLSWLELLLERFVRVTTPD